jgi:hypothetical protein
VARRRSERPTLSRETKLRLGSWSGLSALGQFGFTPPTQLQAIGDTTHINCSARLSEYLGQIVNGLRSKAAWAEELLEYGNDILFPDRNESDEEPTGDRARGAGGHILTPVHAPTSSCVVADVDEPYYRSRPALRRLRAPATRPRGI